MFSRRDFLATGVAAVAAARPARAAPGTLRIGYQKNGILVIAKQHATIEARLKPLGVGMSWNEFPFGPPILEAMHAGAIDFAQTGDAPPLFAEAAEHGAGANNLVYVAAQADGSSASAILVPPGSTLRTLADLKGKRVAFARASSAHNLLIAALEKAGLSYSDIQPVALAPADAAAAFRSGGVDAWSIWDPYYAIAEMQPGVRVLAPSSAIAPQNGFFLARRGFARDNAAALDAVNAALTEATAWASDHRGEVAQILSDGTGVPLPAMQRVVARARYVFGPMTDAVVRDQQRVADRFHGIGLIPAPIDVADAVWRQAA